MIGRLVEQRHVRESVTGSECRTGLSHHNRSLLHRNQGMNAARRFASFSCPHYAAYCISDTPWHNDCLTMAVTSNGHAVVSR